MKNKREQLISQTRSGYDSMAKDFSGTRMNFWPELVSIFEKYSPENGSLLDLGCGNARFFREIKNKNIKYYGCDGSEGLINQAKIYHQELAFEVCDARHTPYENNYFDMVVSFAVLHHIAGKKNQQKFFDEVFRILKPGSFAIITVWNIRKTRKKKIVHDYIKNKIKDFSFEFGDTIMDFTHHKQTRFVHGFSKDRLVELSKKSGFRVVSIENIHRASKKGVEENIVLVVQK